jgi:maltokinase
MASARWFQAKGLAMGAIAISSLPWYVEGPELWLRSEVARVEVGTRREAYHLLVAYRPTRPGGSGAAPESQRQPTRRDSAPPSRPGGSGSVSEGPAAASPPHPAAQDSAVIGTTVLPGLGEVEVIDVPRSPDAMRAFLRAAAGLPSLAWHDRPPDPQSETAAFLGEQSNTTVAIGDTVLLKVYRKLTNEPSPEPGILLDLAHTGIVPRLVGTWSSGGWDLGYFCERIERATDGWTYATSSCSEGKPITDEMRALGATLASLHRAMRTAYGAWSTDGTSIGAVMRARLDQAAAALPALRPLRQRLNQALDLPPEQVPIQRLHGDFHLGQALISPRGWTIIDFEGEPLKPAQERIAPDSVWRDVAGLTRSLDYAAHAAPPTPTGETNSEWLRRARAAFLDGYTDQGQVPALFSAYEIDKAIYEVEYETRNRPSWVSIPLTALRSFGASADRGAFPVG